MHYGARARAGNKRNIFFTLMKHFLFFFKSLPKAFSSDCKVLYLSWQAFKFIFIRTFRLLFLHCCVIFMMTILYESGGNRGQRLRTWQLWSDRLRFKSCLFYLLALFVYICHFKQKNTSI